MKKINYFETPEFQKDLEKLTKKYPSLPEDLNLAKKAAIELFHIQKLNNQSVFPIPNYCTDEIKIYKIRKFACRSLKGSGGRSGIRLIYAFFPKIDTVELIEIYYKGNQENEDKNRIKSYLKNKLASI